VGEACLCGARLRWRWFPNQFRHAKRAHYVEYQGRISLYMRGWRCRRGTRYLPWTYADRHRAGICFHWLCNRLGDAPADLEAIGLWLWSGVGIYRAGIRCELFGGGTGSCGAAIL